MQAKHCMTRDYVKTNADCNVSTGVSTCEDTRMIQHTVEVAETGLIVYLYSRGTDVLLLALR